MATTLQDFESQIQPVIRDRTGTTVETNDIRDSLNRCIRHLINRHGVYATKNRSVLEVFPNIHEYPLPSDFHDIINIQTPGTPRKFTKKTPAEFWIRLDQEDNITAIDTILGNRFLLAKMSSAGSSNVLHSMDSLTTNGTWAAVAASDTANLTADTVNKKGGAASLNFDLDVSNSVNDFAAIDNTTMTAVDISAQEDQGTLFFWAYIPDVTNVTGFTARWGSDSSNYWEASATTGFNGEALRNGWNRIGMAWSGATETGTGVSSAIDYLYLQVTYAAAQTDDTDFRFDDVRMESPENMELHYYSTSFVQTSAGANQATFSATDDSSLLEDSEDDLLFYWALADAFWIKESIPERQEALKQFEDLLGRVKARYVSERKRESFRYY